MPREQLGDVLYDLVHEVAKSRAKLCEDNEFAIVESAYAAALALDHALKDGHVPASAETLRKLRSAKGKLKRELQEWEEEPEPDLEVDTAPPATRRNGVPKGSAS